MKWPLNHRLVFLRADLAGKAFTSDSIVLAIPLLSDAQGFMASELTSERQYREGVFNCWSAGASVAGMC